VGVVEILRDLLGRHHEEAPVGERCLLARLRIERSELGDGVAKVIGFLSRRLDPGAVAVELGPVLAKPTRRPADGPKLRLKAAEGVEDGAVARRIDESAVVVLAVDLDRSRSDRAQELDAYGLVVDEGPGAAVGELDPAQNEVALRVDVALRRDQPRGMVGA
jgi:hypothetical protein